MHQKIYYKPIIILQIKRKLYSPDFVSDDTLAVEYTDLLSVAPKVVAIAELRLSVRFLFGRIFKLVAKSYRPRAAKNSQSKRKNEILTQIGHLWDKNSTNMLREMAGLEVIPMGLKNRFLHNQMVTILKFRFFQNICQK